MKLSRRLIPAFAMLLVSAVLMSTASFAWFSMNDEVTATGMQVTATADGSLVIRAAGSASFSNSAQVTIEDEDKTLVPVTSSNALDFGKLGTVEVKNPDEANASWADTTNGIPTDAELVHMTKSDRNFADYVQIANYEVKSVGGAANVFVKQINVTSNGDDGLLNAVRVAVKLGDGDNGTWYIYQPNVSTGTFTLFGRANNAWTKVNPSYAQYNDSIGTLSLDATANANGSDTNIVDLTVYVWFEGQDPDCTSKMASFESVFDIEVVFGATFS